MKADGEVSREIMDVLNAYSSAYGAKDIGALLSLVAPDPDVVFIGTGMDEWVEGPEELRRGFERDVGQVDSLHIDFRDIHISAAGPSAWLSGWMLFEVNAGGAQQILKGRFTATLERREGKWLFVQAHYSLPAGGQEAGQSYPAT